MKAYYTFNRNNVQSGGTRSGYQDSYVSIPNLREYFPNHKDKIPENFGIFGVFDEFGPSGEDYSKYLSNHLFRRLVEDVDFPNNIESVCEKVFVEMDEEIANKILVEKNFISDDVANAAKSGCTALIVVICDNVGYCVNLGDSTAFHVQRVEGSRERTVVQLNAIHDLWTESERERVRENNGYVAHNRIKGAYKATRGFGGYQLGVKLFPAMSDPSAKYQIETREMVMENIPEITKFSVEPGDVIVLGTGRAWQRNNGDTSVEIPEVLEIFRDSAEDPQKFAQNLMLKASKNRSMFIKDNRTLVAVSIEDVVNKNGASKDISGVETFFAHKRTVDAPIYSDAHVVYADLKKEFPEYSNKIPENSRVFGVFDGFGGMGTMYLEHASDNFVKKLIEHENFPSNITAACEEVFMEFDTEVADKCFYHQIFNGYGMGNRRDHGFSALILIIVDNTAYYVNQGGGRAYRVEIAEDGKTDIVQMDTVRSLPTNKEEKKRIIDTDFKILDNCVDGASQSMPVVAGYPTKSNMYPRGRSRIKFDHTPEVAVFQLKPGDCFFFGTDGIWKGRPNGSLTDEKILDVFYESENSPEKFVYNLMNVVWENQRNFNYYGTVAVVSVGNLTSKSESEISSSASSSSAALVDGNLETSGGSFVTEFYSYKPGGLDFEIFKFFTQSVQAKQFELFEESANASALRKIFGEEEKGQSKYDVSHIPTENYQGRSPPKQIMITAKAASALEFKYRGVNIGAFTKVKEPLTMYTVIVYALFNANFQKYPAGVIVTLVGAAWKLYNMENMEIDLFEEENSDLREYLSSSVMYTEQDEIFFNTMSYKQKIIFNAKRVCLISDMIRGYIVNCRVGYLIGTLFPTTPVPLYTLDYWVFNTIKINDPLRTVIYHDDEDYQEYLQQKNKREKSDGVEQSSGFYRPIGEIVADPRNKESNETKQLLSLRRVLILSMVAEGDDKARQKIREAREAIQGIEFYWMEQPDDPEEIVAALKKIHRIIREEDQKDEKIEKDQQETSSSRNIRKPRQSSGKKAFFENFNKYL